MTAHTKRPNKNHAKIGDKIAFTYKGVECIGDVRLLYQESVLVTITDHQKTDAYVHLEDETIVNHKRYKILHEEQNEDK